MKHRPKISLEMNLTDQMVEAFGWILLIGLWIFTTYVFIDLPEQIPIHFDILGEPDDYGEKYNLLLLPILGTILQIGLSVLIRFPHLFNYPMNITEENATRQYTLAIRLIRYMKISILLIFLLIVFETYKGFGGDEVKLGIWSIFIILFLVFIPIVFYLLKSTKS